MLRSFTFAGLTAFTALFGSGLLLAQPSKTQQGTGTRSSPSAASTSAAASASPTGKGLGTARACVGCELPVVLAGKCGGRKDPRGNEGGSAAGDGHDD